MLSKFRRQSVSMIQSGTIVSILTPSCVFDIVFIYDSVGDFTRFYIDLIDKNWKIYMVLKGEGDDCGVEQEEFMRYKYLKRFVF